MKFQRRYVATLVGPVALAAVVGFATAGSVGRAQESTPAGALGSAPLPSAIVTGACDAPGDVAFELSDLGAPEGTPAAGGTATAVPPVAGTPGVLAVGTTQLEVSNADLLAAEHAVVVFESAERSDVVVACGNVVGTGGEEQVQGRGGQILVRLEEVEGSGLRGQAILTHLGPGSTNVAVMVAEEESAVLATPESAPAP